VEVEALLNVLHPLELEVQVVVEPTKQELLETLLPQILLKETQVELEQIPLLLQVVVVELQLLVPILQVLETVELVELEHLTILQE
jgi:hypothetical protein